MIVFCIYLLIMNIVTFILFGVDKFLAKAHAYRIPEKTLLLFAALGGGGGGTLGMIIFHHKTSKAKFRYTVPALFILYLIAVFLMIF